MHHPSQPGPPLPHETERRYGLFFESALEGFAYCRMLYDEEGRPDDYVHLAVNPAFERLTGLKDVVGKRLTDVFPAVKDETPEILDFYGRVAQTGEPVEFEIDFTPLGLWLHISARQPKPDHFVAVFTDVTERKEAEKLLRAAWLHARSLLEASLDPLVTISADGKITDVNEATVQATGVPRERLIGTDFSGYFTQPDEADAGYRQVFKQGSVRDYPLAIRHASGTVTDVLYSATVYRNESGEVAGVFAAARDISERKRAEAEIRRLNDELEGRVLTRTAQLEASNKQNVELVHETAALVEDNAAITHIAATDVLTGLANRRHFQEALEKSVSFARRHRSALAVVSLDLDGLKAVNDTDGHEAGDEVLASFASLLAALCRTEDLPARLGGDEFSVLLPGIELGGALGLAERVLTAVRRCTALAERGVTTSVGVAAWKADELPKDLLERADEALYAAKNRGGDSVAAGD
jgi:diguanylate cyclase (GGDEF)-like protein/PAS domain S-box-containing protein